MRITPHLLPELTPQLQNLFNLPPNLLKTLLHPRPSIILLMLWICRLPAGTLPPAETVGNASVVARSITWFETARFPMAVPWEFAQPICRPVPSLPLVRNPHLHYNDTVPHPQTCQQKE